LRARIASPLFTAAWAVVTVVTSVVTSDVVFGLRREVRRVERLGQYTPRSIRRQGPDAATVTVDRIAE
jgi:hypothetical protein